MHFLCVVVLAAALTCSTLALDRRPTISFITQPEIVADIGGTVEMVCSVQYAQDYPVIWMRLDPVDRNNDLTINTGTTLILTDPRFHVDFDKSTSSYTLRIEDIQVRLKMTLRLFLTKPENHKWNWKVILPFNFLWKHHLFRLSKSLISLRSSGQLERGFVRMIFLTKNIHAVVESLLSLGKSDY